MDGTQGSVTSHVRLKTSLLAVLALLGVCLAIPASADEIMPLSKVEKGMKGYGLTVFEGNKVEKFDVEIIGVLHDVGPDQNLILAKVSHPVTDRAGVIAGMSGSPIYIDGKVIGALAFAWQFAKEPVAGIQPIEDMLKIGRGGVMPPGAAIPASPTSAGDVLSALANGKAEELFAKATKAFATRQQGSAMSSARPIATPLSLSSFAPETLARFGDQLGSMGFIAVPSGSSAGGKTTMTTSSKPFAPGDPVGAVLLNGDFNVAATGTITHIDGDRIYAFGHPFLDMGEINFPMAKSEIVGVLPSVASSFKFSNTGEVVGAFRQDRGAGIMGVMGTNAEMIPVELTLEGSKSIARTYHLNVVRNSQLSPLLLAMAADTIIANAQRAAGERTITMESEIKLKGFAPIVTRDGWAGAQARSSIPAYLAVISGYLVSNEFRDAEIESVKVRLHHDDELRMARIVEASVETPADGRISPGDTVKVRALLKPYRGESFAETFDVKVPDDQPNGSAYLLVGSGSIANQIDFSIVPPDPRTLEQVLGVLQRLKASTDLTIGLYSTRDGAVAAGVHMPSLPPSMRAVVAGDTSNSAQAPVRYFAANQQARPLGYIIDGAVKIDIDVRPAI
jgi:hypothetical protein